MKRARGSGDILKVSKQVSGDTGLVISSTRLDRRNQVLLQVYRLVQRWSQVQSPVLWCSVQKFQLAVQSPVAHVIMVEDAAAGSREFSCWCFID